MAVTIKGATTIRGNTTVGFSPASLFAAGEQGVWFDPSDFSTMFQDSAGTTPVTAVEQPVGRILDKSGRGNHATQFTSGNRPVLSARVNLLSATATLSTQSVTTVATTYTLYFTGSGSITLSGTATGTFSAGSNSVSCTAGTLTLTVSGTVTTADLRPTNQGVGLPAYQRVNTSTDYDTTGFPLYLAFNGTSSGLSTAAITWSNQQVGIFYGFRKNSNQTYPVLVESFNNSNYRTFIIHASQASGTTGVGAYMGSSLNNELGAYTSAQSAPVSLVGTFLYDASKTSVASGGLAININGTSQSLTNASSGTFVTGSFANLPLNIGYRVVSATPSLWFNGNLYGMIVRGAASTSDQITATENWMNTKTRAY